MFFIQVSPLRTTGSVDWKWHKIQAGKLITDDWLGKISNPLPLERLNVEAIPDWENYVHSGEVGGVSGLSQAPSISLMAEENETPGVGSSILKVELWAPWTVCGHD